ncbi:MAG: type II secretion system F family protein [Dehalococcoidia bacterium]
MSQSQKEATLFGATDLERWFPSFFGIKQQDIIDFSTDLAVLLSSGIALIPSLQALQAEAPRKAMRRVLDDVIDTIRTGESLSKALERHPQTFSRLYRRMIEVGEWTGGLETSLKEAANYMTKQKAAKEKLTKAMSYPIVVFVISLGVVALLFLVTFPSINSLFASSGASLPLPTKILLGFSDFINAYKLYILAAIGAILLIGTWWVKQPSSRKSRDRLILSLPLVGRIILLAEITRVARTISAGLRSGFPLTETIELGIQTAGNAVVRYALLDVQRGLLQGEGLYKPLSKSKIFPQRLIQMVKVGEDTGTLEDTLATAAQSLELDTDKKISTFLSIIGHLMIMGVAILVGFIALSVIMPIYSLTGALG